MGEWFIFYFILQMGEMLIKKVGSVRSVFGVYRGLVWVILGGLVVIVRGGCSLIRESKTVIFDR